MKSNTDKWPLLLNKLHQNSLKIGKFNIKNFFLGITFDCKLKFSNHIEDTCKKQQESWMPSLG